MDLRAYFAGFVDGEGCFTVSFSPRSTLLIGWEVRPSFSVSQNADRSEVLLLMQEYFGCGSIRPDRSDKTLKYEVRCLDDLVEHIIPFFEVNPLLVQQAERFRTIRGSLQAGAQAGASYGARVARDRQPGDGDERVR
jgi:hypothetical protein